MKNDLNITWQTIQENYFRGYPYVMYKGRKIKIEAFSDNSFWCIYRGRELLASGSMSYNSEILILLVHPKTPSLAKVANIKEVELI